MRATIAACFLLVVAGPARAQDTLSPHLRTEAADLRTLLRATAAASPALQALVTRLEGSDLIVYVTTRQLPASIDGRIGWIGAAGGLRFVKIEIACARPTRRPSFIRPRSSTPSMYSISM